MIKKLFPGYAMQESGKFQVGDILLAVNDQILEGMTYQQATAVIRSAPKNVRFIAKRPNPEDIPRELFESSRPVSPEKLLKDCKNLTGKELWLFKLFIVILIFRTLLLVLITLAT